MDFLRIKKLEINGIKSVAHGTLEFNGGKSVLPLDMESDVFGLYGQNGSGKSVMVQTLYVLQTLISGNSIAKLPGNYIRTGFDTASVAITFAERDEEDEREFYYEIVLTKKDSQLPVLITKNTVYNRDSKLSVVSEKLSLSGSFDGRKLNKQVIINTENQDSKPFSPASKVKYFVSSEEEFEKAVAIRKTASEKDTSFIFGREFVRLISKKNNVFSESVINLHRFAAGRFFVSTNGDFWHQTPRSMKSVHVWNQNFSLTTFDLTEPVLVAERYKDDFLNKLNATSMLMNAIIPGYSLVAHFTDLCKLNVNEKSPLAKDPEGKLAYIYAKRNGYEYSLSEESEGIKKLLSVVNAYAAAFGNPSVTVVIDELDAGIFEYLLGELLSIFSEYGKGQLVFTSHNLRPLEVLDKNCLMFTTTNPDDRYTRLAGVGNTSNMRNVYFRTIGLNEQGEVLYNKKKRYELIEALRNTGTNS